MTRRRWRKKEIGKNSPRKQVSHLYQKIVPPKISTLILKQRIEFKKQKDLQIQNKILYGQIYVFYMPWIPVFKSSIENYKGKRNSLKEVIAKGSKYRKLQPTGYCYNPKKELNQPQESQQEPPIKISQESQDPPIETIISTPNINFKRSNNQPQKIGNLFYKNNKLWTCRKHLN